MYRRTFLKILAAAVAADGLTLPVAAREDRSPISASRLPRWRGFNLLEKFTARRNAPYVERDFAWMARWGFDFVRLPMDYRSWTDEKDPRKLDDKVLKDIDQVVAWGKQYGVHINLNLHRAPGYCVNPPREKLDLWTSPEARAQFCFQWKQFAERYRGISGERVSFDLVNEPSAIEESTYVEVMRQAIEAIRSVDPGRLIIVDGLRWGREPVHSLVDLNVGQSTRGYDPMRISHHRASWIRGSDRWEEPKWPLKDGKTVWDRTRYFEERIRPWKRLEAKGAGVHVGEWGAYNRTPHAVALRWMGDLLSLWREAGWGWALWNLRGSFGVVDSRRRDVKYEEFDGHQLDREMLELLLRDGKKS